MTPHEALIQQLIVHEGERFVVYDDATGKPLKKGDTLKGNATIGIGRNLAGKGVTRAESRHLVENDIQECVQDLVTFPWFEGCTHVRQRALIDLRFNLGPAEFRKFTRMLAALAAGQYGRAADELLDSTIAPKRRELLARMIRAGLE